MTERASVGPSALCKSNELECNSASTDSACAEEKKSIIRSIYDGGRRALGLRIHNTVSSPIVNPSLPIPNYPPPPFTGMEEDSILSADDAPPSDELLDKGYLCEGDNLNDDNVAIHDSEHYVAEPKSELKREQDEVGAFDEKAAELDEVGMERQAASDVAAADEQLIKAENPDPVGRGNIKTGGGDTSRVAVKNTRSRRSAAPAPPIPVKEEEAAEWECPKCTLKNAVTNKFCQVCEMRKPPSLVVDFTKSVVPRRRAPRIKEEPVNIEPTTEQLVASPRADHDVAEPSGVDIVAVDESVKKEEGNAMEISVQTNVVAPAGEGGSSSKTESAAKPEETFAAVDEWTCVCTLLNAANSKFCAACEARKPVVALSLDMSSPPLSKRRRTAPARESEDLDKTAIVAVKESSPVAAKFTRSKEKPVIKYGGKRRGKGKERDACAVTSASTTSLPDTTLDISAGSSSTAGDCKVVDEAEDPFMLPLSQEDAIEASTGASIVETSGKRSRGRPKKAAVDGGGGAGAKKPLRSATSSTPVILNAVKVLKKRNEAKKAPKQSRQRKGAKTQSSSALESAAADVMLEATEVATAASGKRKRRTSKETSTTEADSIAGGGSLADVIEKPVAKKGKRSKAAASTTPSDDVPLPVASPRSGSTKRKSKSAAATDNEEISAAASSRGGKRRATSSSKGSGADKGDDGDLAVGAEGLRFALSGLDSSEKLQLQSLAPDLVRLLDVKLSITSGPAAEPFTHLIVPNTAEGQTPARTLKVMFALCRSAPIVQVQWIHESQLAGKWISPSKYLSPHFVPANGNLETLLHNETVYVDPSLADKSLPSIDELKQLIKLTGGKSTTAVRSATIILHGTNELGSKWLEAQTQKVSPAAKKIKELAETQKIVVWSWFVDSIMRGERQRDAVYFIK